MLHSGGVSQWLKKSSSKLHTVSETLGETGGSWERERCSSNNHLYHIYYNMNSSRAEGNTSYCTKLSINWRASFRRTSNGLSFLDLRDSFISSRA